MEQQMESKRKDLCEDFREMVKIYERALDTELGDHYALYDVCRDYF